MPNEPIDELYISIGADVSKLLSDTKKGVAEAEKELKKFGDTAEDALGPAPIQEFLKKTEKLKEEVQKAKEQVEQLGKKSQESGQKSKNAWGGVEQIFGKLKILFAAVAGLMAGQKIIGFFQNIGSAAIAANAQFETFQTQFETLLGSAGAAQKRIDELAEFGVKTPFELPEIVQASRMLEMFGGAALSTGENLTMIGDIAAGVNQPFADVAMWVGRMYDAMQSGRPFGEASMRLQEMGALSGQARGELEKLQKEGASGTVLWERFNELVGDKFTGNMERLSGTFQGVMSNLQDFQGMLLREGGEAFFGQIRDSAKELLDIISTDEMSGAIIELAKALGEAAAMATELATTPLLDSLKEIDPEKIQRLADALEDSAKALAEYAELDTTADLNGLIDTLTILLDTITAVTNDLNRLKNTFEAVGAVTGPIKDVFIGILAPVLKLVDAFYALNNAVNMFTGGDDIADLTRDIADASETETQALNKLNETYQDLAAAKSAAGAASGGVAEAVEEEAEAVDEAAEKMRDKLDGLAADMIDATESRQAALEELTKDHAMAMAEIEVDYINDRLALGHKLAEDLADLDEETADKRADILAKTRESLADLSADTDRELKEERESFERDELRETEDHLLEMRRLRESYLVDIEDAVKNRDAGALRDARRRFEMEQGQREQDFSIQQDRDRQDQDLRLQQIRDEESQRAAEIMQNQERELAQLDEQERQKRQKLDESFQEQMLKLDTEHEERKTKEMMQFNERQTALDLALQKRLETIAKGLADEKEIDEAGAQAILEALNNTFGIGGDIDKLMDDFAKRRRQKMVVQIEFEGGENVTSSTPSSQKSSNQMQQIPTFATGGTLLATKPTLAQFGETPELVQFTPLNQMRQNLNFEQTKKLEIDLRMSGSAPPGVRSTDRDAIAGVLANALREAGVMLSAGR